MKIKTYLSLFLIFTIISCSKKNKEQDNGRLIKVDLQKKQMTELNNLCSRIELIPLETSTRSILGTIGKISESRDYYYILDSKEHVLFKFGKDGRFVCNTKKNQGNGPGEYISMTDFEVNPITGDIEILDARYLRIQTLKPDLTYKKSLSLGRGLLPLSLFKIINNHIYAFPKKNDKGKHTVCFFSIKEKRIIKEIELSETGNDFLKTVGNPFYTYDGRINYNTKNASNIIYRVDTSEIDMKRYLKVDFGQYNINLDRIPKNKSQKYSRSTIEEIHMRYAYLFNISENDKYYIIHFFFQKKMFFAIYNKLTQQASTFLNEPGNLGQFPSPNFVSNNQLIYLSEPTYVKYYISENLLDENSKKTLSQIKETDNPILIKYTIK